jgi:hypothetical protein
MRRLAVLALAVLPLAACSGEQGERAQQLLTRAQTAQARLSSAAFEARMTFSVDGQRFGVVMDGGGYMKGRRAGDGIFSMRTEGVPGGANFTMQVVIRRGRASMSVNGQRFSLPATASAKGQFDWSATVLDLARYVKEVRVREDRIVNGERGATITGVIDTKELLKALAKLQPLAQAAGRSAPDIGELADQMGDIRAAVFVGQRTGLIRSAVVGLTVEAEGKKAKIDVTYRLKSTNTAVAGL